MYKGQNPIHDGSYTGDTSPVDGMTRIITLAIPSLSEGSAKIVRMGLFLYVRSLNSKTIAPIDIMFIHKK